MANVYTYRQHLCILYLIFEKNEYSIRSVVTIIRLGNKAALHVRLKRWGVR